MAIEQTLSIIKPDAVAKGHVDEICKRLEDAGLNIIDKKSLHLELEDCLMLLVGLQLIDKFQLVT